MWSTRRVRVRLADVATHVIEDRLERRVLLVQVAPTCSADPTAAITRRRTPQDNECHRLHEGRASGRRGPRPSPRPRVRRCHGRPAAVQTHRPVRRRIADHRQSTTLRASSNDDLGVRGSATGGWRQTLLPLTCSGVRVVLWPGGTYECSGDSWATTGSPFMTLRGWFVPGRRTSTMGALCSQTAWRP